MTPTYLNLHNLVEDSALEKIEVSECNDMLRLVEEKSWLKIANNSAADQGISKNSVFLRSNVFALLKKARSRLPPGYIFLVKDGYRTMDYQLRKFLLMFSKISQDYPKLSFADKYNKTSKWVAPVWKIVPPHTTGGAIDLTILKNGKELDMGTKVCEFNGNTQTLSASLTHGQKQNRKLLIHAMTFAGFINYPTEWWHWSFGDQYWAAINKTKSIYGTVKIDDN